MVRVHYAQAGAHSAQLWRSQPAFIIVMIMKLVSVIQPALLSAARALRITYQQQILKGVGHIYC